MRERLNAKMIFPDSYIAHITENGRYETVEEHCTRVAELAAKFCSAFGLSEHGLLSGYAHDIGKYSTAFQRRIRGSAEMVDHSTAGAYECYKMHQLPDAFSVMGHHAGLPDLGSKTDTVEDSSFWGRIKKACQGNLEDYSGWDSKLPIVGDITIESLADFMFITRMIYSSLVDADFLATEAFINGASRHCLNSNLYILLDKLRKYIEPWRNPSGAINMARTSILDSCIKKGCSSNKGFFELNVPTGSGKTVSSLAFALEHAVRNKMDRVIYVIPYTSIIEQTADVFRSILGDDCVLEHHSGRFYDSEVSEYDHMLSLSTENWDAPVVVTTSVQFFESLYSAHPARCRKLHNIANSVVVLDEAQMIPVPYLIPCVHSLTELVHSFESSVVLCTATQPVLRPFIFRFWSEAPVCNICDDSSYDRDVFSRVSIKDCGKIDDEEIVSKMMEYNQVLCIVNTRSAAHDIYYRLEEEGRFHLSTLMYPEHRKRVISCIRKRLAEGKTCRVVSTSLIEAGVDVDFPIVMREVSGLDSIMQAAGRCNREGSRKSDESFVLIFRSYRVAPLMLRLPIACTLETISRLGAPDAPGAVDLYFKLLYASKGENELDRKQIEKYMNDGTCPFRLIEEKFRLIDTDTVEVLIPEEKGAFLIEKFRSGCAEKSDFRAKGSYCVSIYANQYNELYEKGIINVLDNGISYLSDNTYYSSQTGLNLKSDTDNAIFI